MPRIVCSPCIRDDKTTECVKYCLVCNENLCRACFREHVKKYSTSRQHHRLIGRDELPEWLIGRQTLSVGSNKCSAHPENDLDSMCTDHDVICCGACAVTVHKFCKNIVDLNETDAVKEREVLMTDCTSTINSLISLIGQRKRNQASLRMSTSESLKDLRAFRKKINNIFDKLEREMVEEIDTRCIELDNVIENDKKDLEKASALLELTVKELKTSEDIIHSIDTAIDNINARKLLQTSQTLQERMAKCKREEVNFIVNKPLENYINTMKNIGYCTEHNHQVSTGTVEEINVPSTSETPFDFQDAIQTTSGDILLLDSNTKTIAKLDENYTICKTYDLIHLEDTESFIGDPYALCCLRNDEIAVSMVRDKLIKTFDIKSDMERRRTLRIDEYCRGVAYNDSAEELYVACGGGSFKDEGLGHIRVYSLQGALLRSFKHGVDVKTALTQRPSHLAISNDCSKVYISDSLKGVICTDSDGSIIAQYSTADLEEAHGLCIDQNGGILVTGYRSINVVRINDTMSSHSSVCSMENRFRNLQAICYDSKRNACVLSTTESNCLIILHL